MSLEMRAVAPKKMSENGLISVICSQNVVRAFLRGAFLFKICRLFSDYAGFSACRWHSLKIRFEGNDITGYVDGKAVVKTNSDMYTHGMAGLIAPEMERGISTPYFDNLAITPLGRTRAVPTVPKPDVRPLYARSAMKTR